MATELNFPQMRYDVTMPLYEGKVQLDGITLKPFKGSSMVFADNQRLRDGDFDLWELNTGYFLPALENGWQLVGLPIYPKRKPVYQFIFCRSDSGINSPKDLEGKRIGTSQYRIVIDIWVRGFLKERHGVDLSKLYWIAQRRDFFPYYDPNLKIDYVEGDKNMVARLIDGEVDAIITDISDAGLFRAVEDNPKVKRLFPNYAEEDKRLYSETGIYAQMHIIVMSKKLDKKYPDLARRLCDAFEQAKKIAYENIMSDMAGFTVVNLRERMKEQLEQWGDVWKYGMKANRREIEIFNRYNLDQGLVRSVPPLEEMFAKSTLET